jgi:hypothetical protein
VTAVTWTELPPDAPEPPPLSVVRDKDGDLWLHIGQAGEMDPWRGVATDGGSGLIGVRDSAPWATLVADYAPLCVAQPEGPLWRRMESVEPSPYEVRHAALMAAVQLYYGEHDDPAEVLTAAGMFEGYLRVGDGDEVFVTTEEWERFTAFDTQQCGARRTTDSRDALICLRPAGHDGWHSGIREDGGAGAGSWSNEPGLDAAGNALLDPHEA